ncbi:MAG: hypothetical protein ACREGB_00320, partial [Candidatus Saccharimonadales bacterium]
YWRAFSIIKSGVHILHTRYVNSPRSRATTVDGIIDDIHALRFRPQRLLLTSGDHFSGLFVRNLGVFYYPMLDAAIPTSKQDWKNRQLVYQQTVAYALGVFAKYPVPTTTLVTTAPYGATAVNFYAYPSDTVYGLLYAIGALLGKESAQPELYAPATHKLQTKTATRLLLHEYRDTLMELYGHYRQTVYDLATGLIRTDLHLSGAKDITRRSSAFYDNVIFWKTSSLAMELGLIPTERAFLDELKQRILDTFWLPEAGYFLEDLSPEGQANAYYSSDWLIVLATGFLRPEDPVERVYFKRTIEYIREHKIDQPFALKYHQDTRAHRQFWAVRVAVASYGGDAIWSFWGMEYIKTLLMLARYDNDMSYRDYADTHIAAYESAMLRNGGFPEVYDKHGKFLETRLYRSIRQTGWVIGFEQVRHMRAVTG